jgi:hypothetical protein
LAFDEVYRNKMAEVKRIEEKNMRIKKILADLSLNDVILQPVVDTEECPETLLDVKDSEVPFERFITKEEQIKIDEEKKREEGKGCIVSCLSGPQWSGLLDITLFEKYCDITLITGQ